MSWEHLIWRLVRKAIRESTRQSSRRQSPYSTVVSAPVNKGLKETADEMTRYLQGKLREGKYIGMSFSTHGLKSPEFLSLMAEFLRHKRHEYLFLAFAKHDRIYESFITKGTYAAVKLTNLPKWSPRWFADAKGYDHIIVGHNHPGPVGALRASTNDRAFKQELYETLHGGCIRLECYVFVRGHFTSY